jgi:uncharacterized protein
MAKEYFEYEFTSSKKKFFDFREGNYWFYIIIFTVFVFILQLIFRNWFTELFFLDSENFARKPWMIFTAMFLHDTGGFWHIFFNMFALLIFGPLIEQKIGSKRFLFLYLIGGIIGNIIGLFFYPFALGASGAIMAMLGTLIILMPNLIVLIWGILPLPLWAAGILWFLLDIFTTLNPSSNIGGIVHIAGMSFGLLFGLYLRSQHNDANKIIKRKKHLSNNEVTKITRRYR